MCRTRGHVCKLCDQVVKTINGKIAGSSFNQLPSPISTQPNPSKIVNWEPGLGWGRTRPLAVPNSTGVQVGLWVSTPQWRGIVNAPELFSLQELL